MTNINRRFLQIASSMGLCALAATQGAAAQQLFTSNDPLSSRDIFAPRALNYWPEGGDFVTVNGRNRFTRALYGGASGFRVETSDRPEFALYMPNMGGNVSLSVCRRDAKTGNEVVVPLSSIPAEDEVAVDIECRYSPGHRRYRFALPREFSPSGRVAPVVELDVMAAYDCDAAIWQVRTQDVAAGVSLRVRYGAATNDRFSREGDMGVDKKDCFDFLPARCRDNKFTIDGSQFRLNYGSMSKRGAREMVGIFASDAQLRTVAEAEGQHLVAELPLKSGKAGHVQERYFMIGNAESVASTSLLTDAKRRCDKALQACYQRAAADVKQVAESVVIDTPDPFFNTLGGVMATAADAIWGEEGVWLHGSIGWRMPLCGWRAAYTGDVVGRHDRARTHFNNYAASQLTDVPPIYEQPMQDSALHLARAKEKLGTPIYSNGYICRMPNNKTKLNHYDMNLVYIDELLWHFNWTGDLAYAREMWPVLTRHLAWEQRNFDPNNDGLYDAYCCIWASDALYYSGSAVTHSSAYNYRANKQAAVIGRLLNAAVQRGELSAPEGSSYAAQAAAYEATAEKILAAMNARLWMSDKGVWAEYQDALGLQRQHKQPAVWTIYHAIDSETATPRQAYSATRYVDREIPHIPIKVKTSLSADANNAAPLAAERAAFAEDIASGNYATISTTNWQPYAWSINNVALAEVAHTALAYWQAGRNDDGFKLLKSALLDAMYLGGSPGNFGQISYYDAARSECYRDFGDPVGITTRTIVQGLFGVRPDRLNRRVYLEPGFPSSWGHASIATSDYSFAFRTDTIAQTDGSALQSTYTYRPAESFAADTLVFRLKVQGGGVKQVALNGATASAEQLTWHYLPEVVETPMVEVKVVTSSAADAATAADDSVSLTVAWLPDAPLAEAAESVEISDDGQFERLRLGDMTWWRPVEAQTAAEADDFGSVAMDYFEHVDSTRLEMIDLSGAFNERVTELFHQQYLSPRAAQTTLALPTQGFGEWCHPLDTFAVDDSYLRKCGAQFGFLPTPLGVRFKTPGVGKNVLFTSQWDNFPTSATVPLQGKASHVYLLMTGTTNAMQSRIANGAIRITYADGTSDSLMLVNPETWWPIEQDYMDGTPTFYLRRPAPYRQCLATPEFYRPNAQTLNRRIEGGATVLLDLPVRSDVALKQLTVETLSNDVVIGLLSVTLQRL